MRRSWTCKRSLSISSRRAFSCSLRSFCFSARLCLARARCSIWRWVGARRAGGAGAGGVGAGGPSTISGVFSGVCVIVLFFSSIGDRKKSPTAVSRTPFQHLKLLVQQERRCRLPVLIKKCLACSACVPHAVPALIEAAVKAGVACLACGNLCRLCPHKAQHFATGWAVQITLWFCWCSFDAMVLDRQTAFLANQSGLEKHFSLWCRGK